MGFDPYLQMTTFEQRIRCLTGFAQRVRTGYFGRGRQVQAATVTGAIAAVGQTISLAIGHNPTKVIGSDKFLPALQVMIEGYAKEDPPTRKMLPVEWSNQTYQNYSSKWGMAKLAQPTHKRWVTSL
jgi:hypothetical protein